MKRAMAPLGTPAAWPGWPGATPSTARHASNLELLTRVLDGDGGSGARLAARFLEHYGNLRSLAAADRTEWWRIRGARAAALVRLDACFEIGRRTAYGRPLGRRRVEGPADVATLLLPWLRDADREHFVAVLLTTKNQVIDVVTVSIGSLSASIVHPREVLKPAIQASAAALVVAHNHPTGVPTPSAEDVEFTRRLASCCELIGIRLLDHVILGDGTYESLREGGHFASHS